MGARDDLGRIPRMLLATVAAVAVTSLVVACAERTDSSDPSKSNATVDLAGATVLEVIALDPDPRPPPPGGGAVSSTKPGPTFHGFPFLGRSESVSAADSEALVADLNRMIATDPQVAWACELPRHAVRLRTKAGELDFVIDLECGNAHIYDRRDSLIGYRQIEGGDPQLWYGAFERAGIRNQSRPYTP